MKRTTKPMKSKDKYKDYILKQCLELQKTFWLTHYESKYDFDVDFDAAIHSSDGDNSEARAITNSSCDYLWYHMSFGKRLRQDYEDGDSRGVFGCLVHEFIHVLTHRLTYTAESSVHADEMHYIRAMVEEQTSRLERVITQLIPEKEYKISGKNLNNH